MEYLSTIKYHIVLNKAKIEMEKIGKQELAKLSAAYLLYHNFFVERGVVLQQRGCRRRA